MRNVSELVKFFKDPHAEKVQTIKTQYQELDDLSNVAVEIGDELAYKSLQSEMKEVFFDYLTAVAVDSIYKLVPHVLIIWIISLKWQYITMPITNWKVNIFGAYLLSYLLFYVGRLLVKQIKTRLSKSRSGLFGVVRPSELTKI